jgi:hypothetical protein
LSDTPPPRRCGAPTASPDVIDLITDGSDDDGGAAGPPSRADAPQRSGGLRTADVPQRAPGPEQFTSNPLSTPGWLPGHAPAAYGGVAARPRKTRLQAGRVGMPPAAFHPRAREQRSVQPGARTRRQVRRDMHVSDDDDDDDDDDNDDDDDDDDDDADDNFEGGGEDDVIVVEDVARLEQTRADEALANEWSAREHQRAAEALANEWRAREREHDTRVRLAAIHAARRAATVRRAQEVAVQRRAHEATSRIVRGRPRQLPQFARNDRDTILAFVNELMGGGGGGGGGGPSYEEMLALDGSVRHKRLAASRSDIRTLPVSKATAADTELTCCICMCDVEAGEELKTLNCTAKHKFHRSCIDHWLRNNGCCPVDKMRIDGKHL